MVGSKEITDPGFEDLKKTIKEYQIVMSFHQRCEPLGIFRSPLSKLKKIEKKFMDFFQNIFYNFVEQTLTIPKLFSDRKNSV